MTTADPALRKSFLNQPVVLYLHRHAPAPATLRTIGILVGLLLLLLALFSRTTSFLVGALILIGSCLVLSLPFIWRKRLTPMVAPGGNGDARPLEITDLLERPVVPLHMDEVYPSLQGRVVLVTGAAGSIGSELCRQLLGSELAELIAVDINETGLFDLVEDLRAQAHPHSERLHPFIGDISDLRRLSRLLAEKRPYIIFHVAAYKHVPLLEQHADLAVRTNALATHDLCRLAQEYQVAQFVYVSTDKAACPVSVMGATKRLAEIIVQSIATSAPGPTRFCVVRFGNVIGSRGSVVPVFRRQIAQGGPITVTDPRATRYFMTIPEACGLLMFTNALAVQGGLYLLNMGEPVRIMDLAHRMARLHGLRLGKDIPLVFTGLRPGERLHETLIAPNEELLPTSHSEIFRVVCREGLPTMATLMEWLETLEHDVREGDIPQLRQHLFSYVHTDTQIEETHVDVYR